MGYYEWRVWVTTSPTQKLTSCFSLRKSSNYWRGGSRLRIRCSSEDPCRCLSCSAVHSTYLSRTSCYRKSGWGTGKVTYVSNGGSKCNISVCSFPMSTIYACSLVSNYVLLCMGVARTSEGA